ncbi:flagellar hook-length control protein FliK [Vibrio japonicus]|uniref:Flagellar hook-length control protein FliK n=1 Tax=Vibrio japonicus TaxID=1824638 RepID=A0ABY5LG21_9VIBR|nr:flagellar hook-length control protein FliK [Vibrio japonicus]UUM29839.1 flagellar hook-length control protein FliK [Vibrio japonicus]
MNIIPSVSTDNPKVTKSAGENAEVNVDGDAAPAEGFLSKLVALVKGSGGEEPKPLVATTNASPEAISESENAESKSTESKIKDTEKPSDIQASESTTDELLAKSAKSKPLNDESDAGQSEKQSASKAELIVSDSQEVLKRLNDANNALQPKSGKALPQQSDADPVVMQTVDGEKGKDNAKLPVKGSEVPSETDSIPESAKRFIQSEDVVVDAVHKTSSEALPESEAKITTQALVAASSNLSDEKMTESSRQLSDEETTEVKNKTGQEQTLDIAAPQPAETQTVKTTQLGKDADQGGVAKLDDEQETDSNAQAIPWAVNNVESASQEVITQPSVEVASKAAPSASTAAVQVTSQSPTPAHATQVTPQSHAASSLLQAETPDVAVTPQLVNTSVSAPVTAAASEQALLKTAMGAKAAATLAGAFTEKPESERGSESSFAHQLAQAAGVQQSVSTTGQPRVEQANTQIPLQLSREMASDEVAERVQMMLSKNLKNIDIRLDPPELGRMQIRMNMNGDGATVHFTVANQQARDALEQSMPRLREMLAQQGVQLGDTSVQQQSGNQQQNRYATNQQSQSGQGSSNQSGIGEENLEADINLDLNVATKRDGISYYA